MIQRINPLILTGFFLGFFLYTIWPNQKKEIFSKNLQLNDNDKICFVVDKNEKSGIEDMKCIIDSSAYEEIWIYLPEIERWYELGVNRSLYENNGVYKSGSRFDEWFLKKVFEKNRGIEEVVFYHNHPTDENIKKELGIDSLYMSQIDTAEMKKQWALYVSKIKDYKDVVKIFYKSGFGDGLPSIPDLESMIKFSLELPEYKIKNKLCSKKGITEYFLTEEGLQSCASGEYSNYLFENPAYFVSDDSLLIKNDYININFKTFEYWESKD